MASRQRLLYECYALLAVFNASNIAVFTLQIYAALRLVVISDITVQSGKIVLQSKDVAVNQLTAVVSFAFTVWAVRGFGEDYKNLEKQSQQQLERVRQTMPQEFSMNLWAIPALSFGVYMLGRA